MSSRVYVEVSPYVTKLLISDYKKERLIEIKRFYNTVSYGDFKNILLEHHPDKPIYLNHKFRSLFDISEGFLGNSLSVNDISIWYVDRLFEEIKEFEKVFLLIDFEPQFVVENQLNSIRSVLISKKNTWSKSNVLMWDLKRVINQIELIKILHIINEENERSLVLANDNYIKYDNELYDLTTSEEEVERLITTLGIYSKPSTASALSFEQIKAIEYEFINNNFIQFDFGFQDYRIRVNEDVINELLAAMVGKIKEVTHFIQVRTPGPYQLLWLGQSKTILDSIQNNIMPKTLIQDEKISGSDKFFFLHNMEEFNKSLKRVLDFKNFFKLKDSKYDVGLDVTFESIHNIVDATMSLNKDKKRLPINLLIEKQLQLAGYRIGNTLIR